VTKVGEHYHETLRLPSNYVATQMEDWSVMTIYVKLMVI